MIPEAQGNEIHTLEPAYLPLQKMNFLIDWLITLKCNYSCDYCPVGPTGHDNRLPHPHKDICLRMLKQMYRYVDTIMEYKNLRFRDAVMNVYGGEALYHPAIIEILIASSKLFKMYSGKWNLKRRMTTNASAQLKNWKLVCEHIDSFTMSYHPQSSNKMKTIFKNNLEYLIKINKEYDGVVLMYPHQEHWQESVNFLLYCQKNKINFRPRLVDGPLGKYNAEQMDFLKPFFETKKAKSNFEHVSNDQINKQGRACCGGRSLCSNRELKKINTFVPRDLGFEGWHCSANWFFLMANTSEQTFYTNKDCRVTLNGTAGPIAKLETMDDYIDAMEKLLLENKLPVMKCVQKICMCGTCAPKSLSKDKLYDIMKIYNTESGSKNFLPS